MSIMDYNNPNEPWMQTGYDPYKGMSLKERQQAGCIHGVLFVVAVVVLIIIAALCHGCTTTKEVIVEKVRTDTVYQNHMQHDSIPGIRTTCSTTQSTFSTLYGWSDGRRVIRCTS